MTCHMNARNPFGYDRYENDDNFAGKVKDKNLHDGLATHDAQKKLPWKRLFAKQTLSSWRHEHFYYDPRAPNDSLDFLVKAKYDHHEDLFPTKNDVVLQPETADSDHGRILKNRIKEVIVPEPFHPLKVIIPQPQRESIHSTSNAIDGCHSAATNQGYSRKTDGGFYSV